MAATRRPITLAAAVATAATLGAALALPALAADRTTPNAAGAAPTIELKDGTLDWGFKESFRRYIGGAGKITVKDGAKQAENNGVFTFVNGKGTYNTGTHATDTAFEGGVNFSAHGGVLDITLSDVKVSTAGTGGAITADVATPQGTQNVAVAALDLSAVKPGQGTGGAMVFKDIPATLTKAGSEAFNGQYKEGEVLDPATLTVTAAAAPTEKPTEKPTDKPTEKPTTKPTEPTGKPSPTATATDKPAAESGDIVDGTLDWGVRASFRSYVTGPIAKGKVETTSGAKATAGGYRFPDATGTYDAAGQKLKATFGGKVRFLGHEEDGAYTLDLSLSHLKVQVSGSKGTLLADVSSKDRATKKVSTYTGLAVADLKLPAGKLAAKDGVVTLSGVPATLTSDGATKAFGGMYQAGEALDALTVAVSVDKDATLPTGSTTGGSTTGGSTTGGGSAGGSGSVGGAGTVGGSGALASTGSDVPTGSLLAASGLIVAAGAGAVVVARRRRTTA
ncbi:HtaA domain-containing protein [Streptomyces sp. NPDC085659]|uniref:HtaA domain-containing protein n=1 Tax=Streptomyces sp. NPDC085659 TaxID=3155177 RepID=UPI00344B5C14